MIEKLGVRTSAPGFPHSVTNAQGETLTLWLDEPALFKHLSPYETGLAVFNDHGEYIASWGLANNFLARQEPVLLDLVARAIKKGSATLTHGHSYFTATKCDYGITVLILNIDELSEAYLALRNAEREVNALRRIGRSLAMNQTLEPLAMMTSYAIAGALDLAAVMLWTNHDYDDSFELMAYSGIDRDGIQKLKNLRATTEATFLAEQVALSGQPVWIDLASANPLTSEVEAQHCYLPAGPIAAIPLKSAHQTVGILELIAKEGDSDFHASKELHQTIAEHLALALNSAILFEKVEHLAKRDPLTGIANHRTMQEFLAQVLKDAVRDKKPVGLVMIDVDHFRIFNEEEGHDSGDEVLRQVAQVLKSNMRAQDLAARYGGEEFTLILPGMDARSTTAVAERVRIEISRIDYFSKEGKQKQITASLGCSVYPHTAQQANELIKIADKALYQAKRNGRNQVVLSPNSDDQALAS